MRSRPRQFTGHGHAKPPRSKRLRKPKHFHAQHPGHCVALDTIELRAQNDRRYIITFIDLHSHFAWAWATRSHASLAATQFLHLIQAVFPFAIEAVLTDNGGEFQRHFATELANRLFTHWHTYPKTPKMNAHCERFNRTVQEECIDYHHDLLFLDDLTDFNLELLRYLSWYNLERPHFSLTVPVPNRKTPRLLSPLQFLHQTATPPVQYVLARYTKLQALTTACIISDSPWGYSSAGRALAWHARGQRFDPAYLHHIDLTAHESLLVPAPRTGPHRLEA